MKENNGRIDSREKHNPRVFMDFPDDVRIKVEELADKFSEICDEVIDFPQTVLMCIDYVYSLKDMPMSLDPVEGGDEE